MQTSEFDYNLPDGLIATHPAEPRDSARLLTLDRQTGKVADRVFSDLSEMITDTDVIVLNRSKVIPARIFGSIGGRHHEVLLVKQVGDNTWETWIRGGRKLKKGDKIIFSDTLSAIFAKREEEVFFLEFNLGNTEFYSVLTKIGEMPIPPYIVKARTASGLEARGINHEATDYQTVYARDLGSVAAPTAGLHFTDELLLALQQKGVQIEYVTLHVGLGTFQPLNTDKIEDFAIHSEHIELDAETATRLNQAKLEGKRIIAVGTTSVRVLESAAAEIQKCGMLNPKGLEYALLPYSGDTKIYIYPGYHYRFVDAMITNFHLPKSSLLLLVSAFAGQENIKSAYKHAIENKYRFYSYGDAMLIK